MRAYYAPYGLLALIGLVWKIDIVRCCHCYISQPYLLTWSAGQRTIHMQERVTLLGARELVVIQARMSVRVTGDESAARSSQGQV